MRVMMSPRQLLAFFLCVCTLSACNLYFDVDTVPRPDRTSFDEHDVDEHTEPTSDVDPDSSPKDSGPLDDVGDASLSCPEGKTWAKDSDGASACLRRCTEQQPEPSCPQGRRCDSRGLCVLGEEPSCQPESDQELCLAQTKQACGPLTITDRCGQERTVECQVDLQSHLQHCGQCNNHCGPGQICNGGQCTTTSCEVDPGELSGSCDLYPEQQCDFETQACTIIGLAEGNPPRIHFRTKCVEKGQLGDYESGQPCAHENQCQPGLFCTPWQAPAPQGRVCSKICRRYDHQGCEADEFCVNPFANDEEDAAVFNRLGVCAKRCSPADRDACGTGESCAPDPSYPEGSCSPNFRCLTNGGARDKSVGSSCNRKELHNDGCPVGLACMPDENGTGDRCVRICRTNSDCSSSSGLCVQAAPPWQMMYHCALD